MIPGVSPFLKKKNHNDERAQTKVELTQMSGSQPGVALPRGPSGNGFVSQITEQYGLNSLVVR